MTAFRFKTRAEQKLEYLFQTLKHRKLTDAEWQDVRRCEHAIYERIRREELRRARDEEAA